MNNKGSVSILMLFFVSIISGLIIWNYKRIIKVEKNIITKTKHYLCIKDIVLTHSNLVKKVEKANKVIITGMALMAIPKTYVAGKNMIKLSKKAQSIFYLNALNRIRKNKTCSNLNKLKFLTKLPYRKHFDRKFHLANLRKKKWEIKLINLQYLNSYMTTAQFNAKGKGSSKINVSLKEKRIRASPSSNFLSGLASSLQ